ncbi:TPA: hypothetical protein MHN43_18960 [Klebsiella pneumoniae]|nr:hypothetical protein [Klebsiella pneumoniae]MBZ7420998.1 hypothetical protein [Klebsiella michiganensis]MBZ7536953.1 hypothetical protein [Klebsiella quasipneumoniae]MBZ7424245.1 hypothetical protein [Klebsiella michiganensis]MBZ7475667.1 hypothetical protein [Klebsiella michiganensis]
MLLSLTTSDLEVWMYSYHSAFCSHNCP